MVTFFRSRTLAGDTIPATNTWTATTTTNAPSGRTLHTAVWTGSEMIVWGGYDASPAYVLNTGGRYNPSTDSWTATSTTNAPTGRRGHTAVWTGSEMIVWGGCVAANCDQVSYTGGKVQPRHQQLGSHQPPPAPQVREPITRQSGPGVK